MKKNESRKNASSLTEGPMSKAISGFWKMMSKGGSKVAAQNLWTEFLRWHGPENGQPTTAQVKQFLTHKGIDPTIIDQATNEFKKWRGTGSSAQSAPQASTQAGGGGTASAAQQGVQSAPQGSGSQSAAPSGPASTTPSNVHQKSATSANIQNYQNSTIKSIRDELKQDTPNQAEVMKLVKELISHAKDHGGPEKDRVKMFLGTLKKNSDMVRKVPTLARIKLENAHQLIDIANMLMEDFDITDLNEFYIVSHKMISEAFAENLMEDSFDSRQKLIKKYFEFVANAMQKAKRDGKAQNTTNNSNNSSGSSSNNTRRTPHLDREENDAEEGEEEQNSSSSSSSAPTQSQPTAEEHIDNFKKSVLDTSRKGWVRDPKALKFMTNKKLDARGVEQLDPKILSDLAKIGYLFLKM